MTLAAIRLSILAPGLALAACASGAPQLTAAECSARDWRAVGEADGREGKDEDAFDKAADACGDIGVAADRAAYMSGLAAGRALFCLPDGGFDAGSRGLDYDGVCPPATEAAFLANYELGLSLYETTKAYDDAVKAYDDATSALARNRYVLQISENRYRDANIADEDRDTARLDIDYSEREIDRLTRLLPKLNARIAEAQAALEARRIEVERLRQGL